MSAATAVLENLVIHVKSRLAEAYARRRVVITGGASFIGSHLAELLVDAGANITIADDLSSGHMNHLSTIEPQVRVLTGDLRQPAFAETAMAGQDLVFHLAACHGGRGYIDTHPVACVSNMALDNAVFAAAAAGGARKIIFASSACTYPTNLQADESAGYLLKEEDANFDEPGRAFADGEYGWAKLMGELQLRAFCKEFSLSGVVCRIFTAYGERENESHAVIALIAKAAARMDPYPIWGNGLQTRNFTYVRDTVTGMALAGAMLEGFDVVNVGADAHHTVLELAQEIFRCMNWEPRRIHRQLDKPVGVKSRAADLSKCNERLNWIPSHSLRDGVTRTVAWYLQSSGVPSERGLDRLLMERGGPTTLSTSQRAL
jgi:nucleoside-diphosphate-sugar epimerase